MRSRTFRRNDEIYVRTDVKPVLFRPQRLRSYCFFSTGRDRQKPIDRRDGFFSIEEKCVCLRPLYITLLNTHASVTPRSTHASIKHHNTHMPPPNISKHTYYMSVPMYHAAVCAHSGVLLCNCVAAAVDVILIS